MIVLFYSGPRKLIHISHGCRRRDEMCQVPAFLLQLHFLGELRDKYLFIFAIETQSDTEGVKGVCGDQK